MNGRTRRTGWRRRLAGSALVLAVLALTGCNAGGGTEEESTSSLAVGLTAEPVSLDFTTNNGSAIPQALLYNVYETLVKVDPEGQVLPALATSWEVSEDRRTYTFELAPDATFSDGAPFTAEDAVFSIERVQQDWTTSLAAAMEVVESATAVGPTTLEVRLSQPSNDWLYRMTTRVGAMFSRTGVDDLDNSPVGTGPYVLSEWRRGDSIVLTRNEAYWGEAPELDEVVLRYIPDPTALNNALLSGTIDVIGTVQAPESLAQFTSDDRFQVIEGTTTGEVVLSFNQSRAPLDDVDVRRAVKHAIDHQALVDTCWAGRGTLIGSMVPPTDPWYTDLTGAYPHDPDRARELLAGTEAESATLRLRVPNLPYAVACGQVVESQLEQVGLDVEMDVLEFPSAWLQTVFTDADYDMSIISHTEPRDMATVFGDPDYYTRYGDPEFVELIQAADTGTETEQTERLREASELLVQDAAADWLFLLPNLVVAERDVTGLPANSVSESFDLSRLGRS